MLARSSLLGVLLLCACSTYVVVPLSPPARPPLVSPGRGRPALNPPPEAYKFRLAVLDFIDQTNSAGDLVRTIPDILTTSLFDTERYDIYDRGQLRERTSREAEQMIRDLTSTFRIDGVLMGSITRFSPQAQEMTVDIRLINAHSQAVMFAREQTLRYTGVLDVKVERQDLKTLAQQIAQAIPKLSDVRVAATNGAEAVLNVGEAQMVRKGMSAFVIATGDTLEDPVSGDVLVSRYIIAEGFVNAVEPSVTHLRLLPGRGERSVRPGDLVHFK
jgi:hypothetical protein